MIYNITLTTNHQTLTAEYLPLAAESVQYLTAKVICETEDWTGREIKAMFGQGCTVHEISVTGGEITAKQQLNLTAGDWRVWLVGNSARDGEVIPRITTNVAHISVAPTGGTEGKPFPIIPPTVEEQLRADMGNLADLSTEDKSSLVAAINEAAESGGSKDAVTYTPQTLTKAQQEQARANISAEKAGAAYTKPASGIPKADLAEDVQTSLAKADTAISLGLSAATPGQIIKVKAVQDGKPTEWEAVDMPGGGETWEKVADIELRADTALYVLADFAVWRKAKVIMRRPTYVSGLSKNVWCRVVEKNNVAAPYYSCGYLVAEYGYSYWDFSAEVSSNVISSATLRNNNTNAADNVRSTQTLTPINLPPTAYELTLTFVDTSVIQDGDKVTVIGVRR
nr:MAG TPA: hypothetical protein [Caudoviricetes sp.]